MVLEVVGSEVVVLAALASAVAALEALASVALVLVVSALVMLWSASTPLTAVCQPIEFPASQDPFVHLDLD